MDIQWHGLSCFTLKGKNGTLVTDPFDRNAAGLKLPKLNADVVVANSDFDLHHAVKDFGGEVRVFDWPGEYESKGIIIQGISAYDRPREKEEGKKDTAQRVIIYMILIDGFKVCHLSNLGHKLTPEMVEAIGDVDILLIPIGAVGCLDAKKAHEVIEQLEPRVVIPMYYKVPGVKLPLAEIDGFLKEVGLHAPVKEKVLKLQSPSNLPQEQTEFKILEPAVG
ncbi:MBL fold metallo-hydrolase [Candidatus Peregrinibacteria bacterium]|nr:MBL fold metallo-hydrolase [Candidatus Peregrinibacteria bacterium]